VGGGAILAFWAVGWWAGALNIWLLGSAFQPLLPFWEPGRQIGAVAFQDTRHSLEHFGPTPCVRFILTNFRDNMLKFVLSTYFRTEILDILEQGTRTFHYLKLSRTGRLLNLNWWNDKALE
jgi:hypothetical protein